MKMITTLFAGMLLLSPLAAQDADCCKAKVAQGETPCCTQDAGADACAPIASEIQTGLVALLGKSWESDFSVSGSQNSPMSEEKMIFGVKGHIVYQDLLHFRLDVTFNMNDPMQGDVAGSAILVLNGSILHAEFDLPPEMKAGMASDIVKLDLSVLPDFAELSTPEAIMAKLQETDTFSFDSVDGGIKETKGAEGTRSYSMGNETEGGKAVFSAKTWFPVSITGFSKEEGQDMSFSMSNSKMVEAFDKGTFDYTPPEGKMVQDMTVMIQMATMQQGVDMGEEELDF